MALAVIGIGFLLGLVYARKRPRQCAEEKIEDLRHQPKHASVPAQLREIRSVINDAHKHIPAVSKGLEKQPAKQNRGLDLLDPAIPKGVASGTNSRSLNSGSSTRETSSSLASARSDRIFIVYSPR